MTMETSVGKHNIHVMARLVRAIPIRIYSCQITRPSRVMTQVVRQILPLVAITAALISTPAQAGDLRFYNATLENGLQLVVVPTDRAPVISHTLLFYSGAADDPHGYSGLAHYLEHLMFKGTPDVPEGEYSERIEALGGQYNAYTGRDMTGYYVTIAAKHVGKVMALEADRMQHLAPSTEAFAKERQVILEERRLRVDNNPVAILAEAMQASLFKHHPYSRPIIGWQHEMKQLGKKQAMRFYERHYTPSNAVLLLVGDITPEKATKLASEHYGEWKGPQRPARNWVKEPPRRSTIDVSYQDQTVTKPRLFRRYAAPSLGELSAERKDAMIMGLLLGEELLGNPRSGVLYETLVKDQKLATEVSVSYDPFARAASTFSMRLVPAKGVSLPELEAALDNIIGDFLAEEIDNRALIRARNQLKASSIYARESVQGMGFIIGQLLMIGKDASWFNQWAELVSQPDQEMVREALRETLKAQNPVTGYLLPQYDEESTTASEGDS